MQTADFNPDDFTDKGTSEADKQLLVKFEKEAKRDPVASSKEGRPIFTEVEIIDIKVPGKRAAIVHRIATYADKSRFPEHYKLFKERVEGAEDKIVGTPLAHYPAIPRTLVEELAFFNVFTVENLAGINDGDLGKFPNGNTMKREAKEWLARAGNDSDVIGLKAELAKKDERLDKLEAQIAELLAGSQEPAPKKRRSKTAE
jgi:hypothetical protein